MRALSVMFIFLLACTAQAFPVTVDSAYREVTASADDNGGPSGFVSRQESSALTGNWSQNVSASVSSASGSARQTSDIQASGDYGVYRISYDGYASSGGIDQGYGRSRLSVDLTFADDVYYWLDTDACRNNISLNGNGSNLSLCASGNREGLITAGTYRFSVGDTASLSGADSSGFAQGESAQSDYSMAFSRSAIPVPGAVWLFVSSLGLLGWRRRNR